MQGLQLFGEDNLKASDWMAIEQAEQDAQADRMVVLSDVWLDKPEVLDQLHTVFSGTISHTHFGARVQRLPYRCPAA